MTSTFKKKKKKFLKKGRKKKPNKKGKMSVSRGKQKKNSRKNKAVESGQEADLEREEAEFEHVVEREIGVIYHQKNHSQKKKNRMRRRIGSVRLAVKTMGLQMTF